MQIQKVGSHYTYLITNFDKKSFPVKYDEKVFPDGFDTINIDCYGDGTFRHMILSKEDRFTEVRNKSDIGKIVMLIEGTVGFKRN